VYKLHIYRMVIVDEGFDSGLTERNNYTF